jgi:hypothetical protein
MGVYNRAPNGHRNRGIYLKSRNLQGGKNMRECYSCANGAGGKRRALPLLAFVVAPALFGVISLAASGAALAAAPCQGPGAPTDTQTRCLTAVQIPGNPLRSFDISFVNPDRAEFYFADRSNKGITIIDTRHNVFKRRLGGFVGAFVPPSSITPANPFGTVNNNLSGPDGVVTHGRWLYAGDGDSTLKVFDLNAPTASAFKASIPTGGSTRVDEMALTTDGTLLLGANNAEDPPFGTLFVANGDSATNHASIIVRIGVDNSIIPAGAGLSIEQPAWEPKTKRFYVSVPQIANNPAGCTFGGPNFCEGGLLIIDPANLPTPTPVNGVMTSVMGPFNSMTNTGVFKLNECAPNGASVGPHANLLLGCTPQNVPTNSSTLVINAKTKNFANIGNITGSDEVWFNAGDDRYYTGSSRDCGTSGTCPDPSHGFPGLAQLGVIDGETNLLIEKIPQGSNSHSVAADSRHNFIYVPQVAPRAVVGSGGDVTTVGAGICGSTNGCVAVYVHDVDEDRDEDDEGGEHHDR